MKIVYLCNEYPPAIHGGIGSVVKDLARGLSLLGHDVTVVGVYPEGESSQDGGAKICRLPKRTSNGLAWFRERRTLRSWIKAEHERQPIDILEVPDFGGWFPNPIKNLFTVVRIHGPTFYFPLPMAWHRAKLTRYLETKTLRNCPVWIGVSRFALDRVSGLTGLQPKKSFVIPNGVDCQFFTSASNSPPSSEPPLILCVGTVSKVKGALAIAQSSRLFLQEFPTAKLVFAGRLTQVEGVPIDQIIKSIAGDAVAPRIEFLGPLPNGELPALYQRASLVLAPSRAETCGLVWLEAMACGRPLIASTTTCGPEVVGDAGLLADPSRPEQLAEHVARVLRDPSLAQALGKKARNRVLEWYSLGAMVDRTLHTYESLLKDHA